MFAKKLLNQLSVKIINLRKTYITKHNRKSPPPEHPWFNTTYEVYALYITIKTKLSTALRQTSSKITSKTFLRQPVTSPSFLCGKFLFFVKTALCSKRTDILRRVLFPLKTLKKLNFSQFLLTAIQGRFDVQKTPIYIILPGGIYE